MSILFLYEISNKIKYVVQLKIFNYSACNTDYNRDNKIYISKHSKQSQAVTLATFIQKASAVNVVRDTGYSG